MASSMRICEGMAMLAFCSSDADWRSESDVGGAKSVWASTSVKVTVSTIVKSCQSICANANRSASAAASFS